MLEQTDEKPKNRDKEIKQFIEEQSNLGFNYGVMFYMAGALNYMKKLPKENIQKIAFEIAFEGIKGISVNEDKKYRIKSIADKEFTGYQFLAWYYVSWSLYDDKLIKHLNLPYDREYKAAQLLSK